MEDGQDPKLDEKATSREQHKGKDQVKRNPQIIMMGSIILLLILALIFIATPLKGMFLPAKTVPEIALELVTGPELEESGQYRFEVQAMVSGNPIPEVSFSRDDSLGEVGENRAVVFLNPGESFVLTAVAKNSQGSMEASLELIAAIETAESGEEDEGEGDEASQNQEETADEDEEEEEKANRPPEITSITMMGTYYTGLAYGMSVSATDPDGDPLSYSWAVDDGFIDDPASSTITWTMPSTAGFYNITVTVEDGKGGRAERTETVEVLALPTISLDQIPGGGFIIRDSLVTHELNILVGDSNGNRAIRGYLSFDISGLAGKMILSAEMRFNKYHKYGNPFGLIEKIWVESVYWGTEYIQVVDDNLPGVMLGEYDIPTFTCSGKKLVDELSQALGNGHDRFQVRLRHKGYNTNHNDTQDAIQYGGNFPVEFIVTYLP